MPTLLRSGACAIVERMWRSWIVPMVLIASGCEVVFPIEAPDRTDAGTDGMQGPGPRVFSSPGPAAALYGGYPKALSVTLAADDPSATIYYTTDGSAPSTASASAPSPASVSIPSTKTLRYFSANAAGQSTVSGEVYSVVSSAQGLAGYLVTGTTLDGTSPVVIATPGQGLAAKANLQVWVQSSCSACGAQVVYGVDDVDQGCLYDASPGVYPGITATKSFNVVAPTTPGVHEVRIAHIEETSCLAAMSSMALANRPTVARIGVIIVP